MERDRLTLVKNILTSEKFKALSNIDKNALLNNIVASGQITPDELRSLIKEVQNTESTGKEFITMPKDVFRTIVLSGEIKGRDLVSLCSSNSEIRFKCDQDDYWLYRQLLLKDFNLKHYKRNPKDLYVLMHHNAEMWKLLKGRFEDLKNLASTPRVYGSIFAYTKFAEELPNDIWTLLYEPFRGLIYDNNMFSRKSKPLYKFIELGLILHQITHTENMAGYRVKNPFDYIEDTSLSNEDLEDIWFDTLRPKILSGEIPSAFPYRFWSNYTGNIREVNISIDDIDEFWDTAGGIVSQLTEKDMKKTINDHFVNTAFSHYERVTFHKPDLGKANKGLNIGNFLKVTAFDYSHFSSNEYEDYTNEDKINNLRSYIESLNYDFFELADPELDFIISLHELVVDGTLSVTMPLAILERNFE